MENKIGYAYISLEDYRELIEENKRLKYENEILECKKNDLKKEYENVEKTICDKIYNSENYTIAHYDGIGEYYHRELFNEFQKYGYMSSDKINELIQSLVERHKEEREEKGDEEES